MKTQLASHLNELFGSTLHATSIEDVKIIEDIFVCFFLCCFVALVPRNIWDSAKHEIYLLQPGCVRLSLLVS